MSNFLRQATASQARAVGPFVDDTDFKTAETGLTIANTDIKLVVNGAASANKNSGGGTHRVNGIYGVTFDATDTATVGEMEVSVVVAGALPVFKTFYVVEEAVFDALFVASAPGYVVDQPVNVTKLLGTAWLTPGTAGTPDVNVKLWNGLTTVELPLVPTTAGRKLDVSAGGEAGVDWANVGSPTTSLALTGTTIATTQKVDVETIKTNPVVNAGTVTFPTTATLASTTGAVGSVTGNLGGNVTGSVGSVAAGGIAAASFAAGAIDAAAIATNAFDADALAADAVSEIQSGLSTLTAANVRTAVGLASANLDTQLDALPTNAEIATALGTADDAVLAQVALVKAVTDKLNTTIESVGSPTDYVFTAQALAQAPSGTGASAIAIANEVQTRTIAGVTLVTTTTNLTNAPTSGDLTATMKASVTTAATASTPALSTAGNAAVADKLLGRNVAGGSDGVRTVSQSHQAIRNKTAIVAGTLTVYGEDDTTPSWTATVTTAAGDPLTSIDPA